MTALEIVNIKLEALDLTSYSDAMKNLLLDEVEQSILNYCNITEVPDGLTFTWANMTLDYIRYEHELSTSDSDADIDIDSVDSVKVGDTSLSLKGGNTNSIRSKVLNSHSTNLDSIVLNYHDQLNAYRKMVW